jgi:two-component system cell cycle sensor histidine kinase/response regulator CckA
VDETQAARDAEAIAGVWACLSVSDTGTGISREVLPSVFEPFFTTKDVGKGTGLGLSTVYGIVRQHQGWLSVDSSPGLGSTFKAFLPLLSEASVVASSRIAEGSAGEAERGHDELILVVEDEPGVRSVLQNILEQHGYRLIVVNDGREALEAFARRGAEIDLLLTDVMMPLGLTGTELVARLQEQKPDLKAILCSGYSAESASAPPGLHGRATFLQKPYRFDQLLHAVRQVLDGGRPLSKRVSHGGVEG